MKKPVVFISIPLGEGLYSTHCVQKLQDQELDDLVRLLMLTFSQQTPPPNTVMEWILAAKRAGFICGTVYTARGGHVARGELRIIVNKFPRGICPWCARWPHCHIRVWLSSCSLSSMLQVQGHLYCAHTLYMDSTTHPWGQHVVWTFHIKWTHLCKKMMHLPTRIRSSHPDSFKQGF